MPINIVINGYFRSGTTYFWNLLRANVKFPVFYEPLHPQLSLFINRSQGVDETHGMSLWEEYSKLPLDVRLKLCRCHPFLMGRLTCSDEAMKEYFDVLMTLKGVAGCSLIEHMHI